MFCRACFNSNESQKAKNKKVKDDSLSTPTNDYESGLTETNKFLEEQNLIFQYYDNMKINNFVEAVNIANKLISFSFLRLGNTLKKLNKTQESRDALKLATEYDKNNKFLHLEKKNEEKSEEDGFHKNKLLKLQIPPILQCYQDVHQLFDIIFKDLFDENENVVPHYNFMTEDKLAIDNNSEALKVYKYFADSKCPQYFDNNNYRKRLFESVDTIYKSKINNDFKTSSRRFLAKIPTGYCWSSLLGNILSYAFEQHPGLLFISPTVTGIHDCCINWFCEWFGYDKNESSGYLATGGSLANNIGVLTARDWKLNQNKTDYKMNKLVCYISLHTHGVVRKGLLNNGIKPENIRIIAVIDKNEVINTIEVDLKNGYIPFLIASTCGDSAFGECDNLLLINEICKKYDIWHHCDAAYAGPFILIDDDQNIQNKFKGINQCDSLVFDPHKSLFVCNGVGCILIRNKQNLLNSCNGRGYICPLFQDTKPSQYFNLSNRYNEMTRNIRCISTWLPIQVNGINKFKNTLKYLVYLTDYLYLQMMNDKFFSKYIDIYSKPSFTIFTFKLKSLLYIDNKHLIILNEKEQIKYNKLLLDEINKKGFIAMSGVTTETEFLLRICILNIEANQIFIDSIFEFLKQTIQSFLSLLIIKESKNDTFTKFIEEKAENEENENEENENVSALMKLERTTSICYRRSIFEVGLERAKTNHDYDDIIEELIKLELVSNKSEAMSAINNVENKFDIVEIAQFIINNK